MAYVERRGVSALSAGSAVSMLWLLWRHRQFPSWKHALFVAFRAAIPDCYIKKNHFMKTMEEINVVLNGFHKLTRSTDKLINFKSRYLIKSDRAKTIPPSRGAVWDSTSVSSRALRYIYQVAILWSLCMYAIIIAILTIDRAQSAQRTDAARRRRQWCQIPNFRYLSTPTTK